MKMTWAEKNERRKSKKGESTSYVRKTYRDGRRNRRVLANKGAFGNLKGRAYNLCALGTWSSRTDDDDSE